MVNVVSLLASPVSAPSGLWAIILNWIESGIVNYGWVIILFTLLIKMCLSPLDLLMKFSSKKSTLVQQKLAPQIARINQKYQNDKNAAQMQTNALYKKEGYNVFVSCLVMILNLAITMTVFFTLFASLREMSAFKAINQYDAMQTAYVNTYNENLDQTLSTFKTELSKYKNSENNITLTVVNTETNETSSEVLAIINYETEYLQAVTLFYTIDKTFTEEEQTLINTKIANKYLVYNIEGQNNVSLVDLLVNCSQNATTLASESANEVWASVKENWLWIENIWVSDNYKSPLPTYGDLKELAASSKNSNYSNYVNSINENLYSQVTSSVHKKVDRWNGYFVLAILAGVLSFLSQFITEKMSKPKNKQVNKLVENSNPTGGTMKFMKILLPAMMVIFVLTSSSAFGLYIVSSSIISMGISALTTVIVNACYKKKETEVMEYLEKHVQKSVKRSKRKLQGE